MSASSHTRPGGAVGSSGISPSVGGQADQRVPLRIETGEVGCQRDGEAEVLFLLLLRVDDLQQEDRGRDERAGDEVSPGTATPPPTATRVATGADTTRPPTPHGRTRPTVNDPNPTDTTLSSSRYQPPEATAAGKPAGSVTTTDVRQIAEGRISSGTSRAHTAQRGGGSGVGIGGSSRRCRDGAPGR